MKFYHSLLAVLVMVIWGVNFVISKVGLKDISPFLLCSARFFFTSIPLVIFLKRPPIPFKRLIMYGLIMFACQYTLLFSGMLAGVTAGLASLLYQSQVFFTLMLAFIFLKEKISFAQLLGLFVSFAGIGLVAFERGGNLSLLGVLLILAAAFAWSIGNIISKRLGQINMLALVAWGNLVAWPPLFILTYWYEGKESILKTLSQLTWQTGGAVLYIAYFSTVIAFSGWSFLISRYPVTAVAPFTLLVPVVGMASSIVFLDEPIYSWKIVSAGLIIGGLVTNMVAQRFRSK